MPAPSFVPFGRRAITSGGVLNMKHKLNGIRAINKTGSAIAVDKLVAVVGYDTTAELPKIVLADADVATHKQVYVTLAAISNNSEGWIYEGGLSTANLNTNSATAAGDPVYLSTTAGGFAHTAPATGQAIVLPVGWVVTKSATIGEIHWHIGAAEKLDTGPMEVVAATNVITAAESGSTFFLNLAGGFESTLPAPALGLRLRFVVSVAPTTSYTIVTNAAAQIIFGGQHDAGGAAGDVESTGGATTITFVASQAVVGDWAELVSDGTNWYARVFTNVAAGATFTG